MQISAKSFSALRLYFERIDPAAYSKLMACINV